VNRAAWTSELIDHFFERRASRVYPTLATHGGNGINYAGRRAYTFQPHDAELTAPRLWPSPRDRLYTVIDGINHDAFARSTAAGAGEDERRRLRVRAGIPEGRIVRIVSLCGVMRRTRVNVLDGIGTETIPGLARLWHFLIMASSVDRYQALAESAR